MTLTIKEAFDLPTADEIRALGFVVRLEGGHAGAGAGAGGIVDSYVITPHVGEELPRVFKSLKRCRERGEEVGWFVHGSFGSGKSHFMSFLGMLLEGNGEAWNKEHDTIRALAEGHRGWIEASKLLVVRIHMLSTARKNEGFDRVVYKGFNRALESRGKAPFEFLNVEGVLDQARREAERYGESFWRQMREAKIARDRDHFEKRASGSAERQEELARKYLDFTGSTAEIDPNWAEGLRRMAEHAKQVGFGGVVFLVDELLLWLGEKTRDEFVGAINHLNTFVDYGVGGGGKRAVPMAVLVARQRRISDFFPDMVSEDHVHEYLDHHGGRFELLELEDVELRWVCKERVLRRREPEAVAEAIERVVERHRRLLPELVRDAQDGEDYLRDVYPFHPALIEMLIDISNLMQRERTALRLLYELLVVHYPALPLGEFLPVGSAFEAIFPKSGVEGTRRLEELRAIHRIYWQRFLPAMERMSRPTSEGGSDLDTGRRRVLDQLVKTALLAEVSPRLKGTTGLTVDRLVKLNDADVSGETPRGKILKAYADLVDLTRLVPDLQVTGKGGAAAVSVVLRGADFGQLLAEARAKVDNPHLRFKTFYAVLKSELGVTGRRGFGEGEAEGELTVTWRGTKRRGSLAIANVREMTNKQFKVRAGTGEEFRLLVDYPWDEGGHTVEEDRRRAADVRRRDGQSVTLCWLPRHMTGEELKVITDLAAARFLLDESGQEELLGRLGPTDRKQVVDQARAHAESMETRLRELLREVYKDEGQTAALMSDVQPGVPEPDLKRNLDHFARTLLDRRFPSHPNFETEPKPKRLETLCDWMVEASERSDLTAGFDAAQLEVLRKLGRPLEVVDPPGTSRAQLRLDTRFISVVLAQAEAGSFAWQGLDSKLEDDHGLQPAVRNLFSSYLLRARSFRARDVSGAVVDSVPLDNKAKTGLRLERAPVVDAPTWSRARELAAELFDLESPSPHRSLQAQDALADKLRKAGMARRETLSKVHERIAGLVEADDDDRRQELRDARERLKPLSNKSLESHEILEQLVDLWSDDPDDTLRTVVSGADVLFSCFDALDTNSLDLLRRGRVHSAHQENVKSLLGSFEEMLSSSFAKKFLKRRDIEDWNTLALTQVAQMIAQPTPPPKKIDAPVDPKETAPLTSSEAVATLSFPGLRPLDPEAFGDFVRDLREKLRAVDPEVIDVEIVVRAAKEPGDR